MLAVLLRNLGSSRQPAKLSIPGLVLILVAASGLFEVSATLRGFLATAAALTLLLGLMSGDGGLAAKAFANPLPAYLGRISYGTYLWHWPVLVVIGDVTTLRPLVLAIVGGAISTGLAALSYHAFEMPIRRREWSLRIQWPVVLTGLAVSGLVALLLMPPMLQSTRRTPPGGPAAVALGGSPTPAAGQTTTSAGSPTTRTAPATTKTRVPRKIDWEAVVNDHGVPHTCTGPSDCYIVKGDGPTVVLVGDSHAQMFEPMFRRLAKEHGFSLAANMQIGCPWQAGIVNYFQPPNQREQCTQGRQGWYDDVLPKLHPDLVIVVSQSYDAGGKFKNSDLQRAGGSDESVEKLLLHTTRETLQKLHKIGTRVLIVQNTIKADFDPLDCLAGASTSSSAWCPSRQAWAGVTPSTKPKTSPTTTFSPWTSTRSSAPTHPCAGRSSTAGSSGASTTTSPGESVSTCATRSGLG